MAETAPDLHPAAPSKSLIARIIGVLVSPSETYADVAATPRLLGVLIVTMAISVGALGIFSSTKVGKELTLDQAVRSMEAFGVQVNDQMYTQMESRIMSQRPYGTIIGATIFIPLLPVALAGIVFAVFTPLLGGQATFKQVYAVVLHSGVVLALQALFIYPMFYMKESMASPTSLAVFLPFLADGSFAGRLAGAVDLFRLWWLVNLALGVGVLYKRKAGPVVWSLLAVYALIALVAAGVGAALSGA